MKTDKIKPEYDFTNDWPEGFSIEDVEGAEPCEEDFTQFCFRAFKHNIYDYDDAIDNIDHVLEFAATQNNIDWLIEHNFIRDKSHLAYHVGEKLIHNDDNTQAMIIRLGGGNRCLVVDLSDGVSYGQLIDVKNHNDITQKEFKEMAGDDHCNLTPIQDD
jgi:hypothetical protein